MDTVRYAPGILLKIIAAHKKPEKTPVGGLFGLTFAYLKSIIQTSGVDRYLSPVSGKSHDYILSLVFRAKER